MRKKNVHKIKGAHYQYVYNQYAKFEYKRILLKLQITQTRHSLSISDGKMPKFNTPQNEEKCEMCTKKEVCISNM